MNQQRGDINTVADAAAAAGMAGQKGAWEVLGCTERSAGYFEKLSDSKRTRTGNYKVLSGCIV